jgi:protocatechuate 3,4-dioxygenase alpha subunit
MAHSTEPDSPERGTTPWQTVGPFFSIGLDWLNCTNITADAQAQRVTIRGRIWDGDGQGVPDAFLEIWQADAQGKYCEQPGGHEAVSAKKFFGFARVPTNERGEFSFVTTQPGRVPGYDGKLQAPHLNISIFMRGLLRRLVTRMYFPDQSANEADTALASVPVQRRATLIARKAENDRDSLHWDVRLQGEQETVFFAE